MTFALSIMSLAIKEPTVGEAGRRSSGGMPTHWHIHYVGLALNKKVEVLDSEKVNFMLLLILFLN